LIINSWLVNKINVSVLNEKAVDLEYRLTARRSPIGIIMNS